MQFIYKVTFNSKEITITRLDRRTRQEVQVFLPLEAGIEYDIEKLIVDAIADGAFD